VELATRGDEVARKFFGAIDVGKIRSRGTDTAIDITNIGLLNEILDELVADLDEIEARLYKALDLVQVARTQAHPTAVIETASHPTEVSRVTETDIPTMTNVAGEQGHRAPPEGSAGEPSGD
jgi:hypothetical protein